METGPGTRRVVIELHRGEGRMRGRFWMEEQPQAASFDGWVELLALLESARAPPGQASPRTQ